MSHTLAATLALIEDLRRRGRNFCVVTVVRTADATSAKAGAKAVVTEDGKLHGFVGGGCVQGAVERVALDVLASGEPRLIRVAPKDRSDPAADQDGQQGDGGGGDGQGLEGIELYGSSCPSGGTVELFLEPTRQLRRILICGRSPVGDALVRLAAAMGYQLITAPGTSAGPSCDQTEPAGASHRSIEGFDFDPLELGPRDAVVIATQGRQDRQALAAALGSPAGYVGMVGSRKKIKILLDRLDRTIPEERKRTLHGPAGLDIGAIDPEEIALSILSEIVSESRKRR